MIVKIDKAIYSIDLASNPAVSGPNGVLRDLLEQEVEFAREDYTEARGWFPQFLKNELLAIAGSDGVEITIEEADAFDGIPEPLEDESLEDERLLDLLEDNDSVGEH